ncbi:MAG: DUF2851 family protein, partial [Muribaculaceae bacterium]|nr:DUF2851 family protein [Muribaculaceae bacterium]
HKFALPEPPPLGWRMARTRPQNFPHRRIAALAAMVTEGFGISSEMCELHDLQSARNMFAGVRLPYYWQRRYTFGKAGRRISEFAFSAATADSLVINVAIPAMHAYGSAYGLEEVQQRAFELLEQLPPENNNITRLFASAGIRCRDAFTSQALIQLRKAYCEPRKCLYCRLGHRFLSQKAKNDRLKENQ